MISHDMKPLRQGEHVGMEGENYIIAISEEEAYALNPAAYYIWTLCDGVRTVDEIISKVANDLKLDVSEVESPVEAILEALSQAKLVVFGETSTPPREETQEQDLESNDL
jgi:Coenzyme PQQ synthesis protein D (PqqD).